MTSGFDRHEIGHLSPSSINLWTNAPALWVAEKVFGYRRDPAPAMTRGIVVENAAVAVLRLGDSIEDASEQALSDFDAAFPVSTPASVKERALIEPMICVAVDALISYGIPEPADDGGQHKIELVCNCGDFKIPVIGYLDMVYPEAHKVVDLKTTQRIPSKMSPEHQLQRAIYARARRDDDVSFCYVSNSRFMFLADGDVDAILARVKYHVRRLEAFLRLDREQMQAIVPLNDANYFFTGAENILTDLYGLPVTDVGKFPIDVGR
jgi:hypothetical protein